MERIVDLVDHQVIAAVRSEEQMKLAIQSEVNMIFLLAGNILHLESTLQLARAANKLVFLHLEFMEGIAADRSGMKYIAQRIRPTGIVSTRSQSISMAKDHGMMAIQRLFLIDSTAVKNGIKTISSSGADAVEVMPGIVPHIISDLTDQIPLPIIAGGLVRTQQEIHAALEAGALAVSVGNPDLWNGV